MMATFAFNELHAFFISNALFINTLFSTQPQCWLTFHDLSLTCCLRVEVQEGINILRYFLFLLYLCPCVDLGLFLLARRFMSYICDLFFILLVNRYIALLADKIKRHHICLKLWPLTVIQCFQNSKRL